MNKNEKSAGAVGVFEGYVDGQPLVKWLDRRNMPQPGARLYVGTAPMCERKTAKLEEEGYERTGYVLRQPGKEREVAVSDGGAVSWFTLEQWNWLMFNRDHVEFQWPKPVDARLVQVEQKGAGDAGEVQAKQDALSSRGIDKLIEQHTGMTARQDARAHAELQRLAYAVLAADIQQAEQPFAIVRGYHVGTDLPALAWFNGAEYQFDDGHVYGREGDTLAGYPAEFLTHHQLEQKIAAAPDNFGRAFPLLTMDPRTLRAALRQAWMAGRVDLGAVHWSGAEKYATKALAQWSSSSATLDWCPECHARDTGATQTPDPLGDPGEKGDWLSTILHRLPCVPRSAGLTPEQFRLYKMGFHQAMHEAGRIAKQYVDPRLMAADRACARADKIIAELMGLDQHNEISKGEKQ